MLRANEQITLEIIKVLPDDKLEKLIKVLDRNEALTSTWDISDVTITVYKQGWYIEFIATRSRYAVFAYDRDGDYEITDRKPHENKLDRIYSEHLQFSRMEIAETVAAEQSRRTEDKTAALYDAYANRGQEAKETSKDYIKQIWDGDSFVYLLFVGGEHVLSAYTSAECLKEAEKLGVTITA